MHYMRRRSQKGKGLLNPRAKGVTSEDVRGFPLLGLLASASWVIKLLTRKEKKYKDQANNKTQETKRRDNGSYGTD